MQTFYLKKEYIDKSHKLQKAQYAQAHLEELQKQLRQKEEEWERLNRRIPKNEEVPLELIKMIISSASQFELRNVEFSTKRKEKEAGSMAVGTQEEEGLRGMEATEGMMEIGISHKGEGTITPPSTSIEVEPLPVEMTFECTFFNLILFLDWLSNMERLVSIEDIKIERKEKILPRQEITLRLVAYTLLSSP